MREKSEISDSWFYSVCGVKSLANFTFWLSPQLHLSMPCIYQTKSLWLSIIMFSFNKKMFTSEVQRFVYTYSLSFDKFIILFTNGAEAKEKENIFFYPTRQIKVWNICYQILMITWSPLQSCSTRTKKLLFIVFERWLSLNDSPCFSFTPRNKIRLQRKNKAPMIIAEVRKAFCWGAKCTHEIITFKQSMLFCLQSLEA